MEREPTHAARVSGMRASAVYLIFALSGASALIYQVIWSRWLGLIFGNTTLSISIVLGCFMLGLAVGSWLAGRLLHRIHNPMRYYAIMELGIGVFALFFPAVMALADVLFSWFAGSGSLSGGGVLLRAALSAALLFLPTTFMGATLPLLTDFFHRSPRHNQNWKVGLLYTANTLGAALGIVVASFILIELFGVLATTFVAAGLNFVVAAIGFWYSRAHILPAKESTATEDNGLDLPGRVATTVIAVSGFLAMASEVLWTRTLELIIGNSTYAFATLVFLYLLGIAVGSWIMSLLVNRLKALPVWLTGMLLLMGLWMTSSIMLFEYIGSSTASLNGKMVPLSVLFGTYLKAIVVLLPLAVFSGACFPLATRIIDPASGDAKGTLVARAYAWNTVGAVIGSLAAGFVIAPLLDYLNSLYLLAALYCLSAAAACAVVGASRWQIPYKLHTTSLLGIVSIALLIFSSLKAADGDYSASRYNARNPNYTLAFHKPGMQGVTSVLKHKYQSRADRLMVNGMGMTVKISDTKMMAHLPMLIHPDPDNTLVVCFGMGTTYRSATSYGKKVTVVELVKEVLDAFDYFHADAPAVRSYPGGRMLVNDGRNFLKTTRERFDVITIDPPPPIDAAGVNSLHSREFIELARDRLKKRGIMAHWIPFPGTGSGVDDRETHAMLIRTFAQVFPYTYAHRSVNGVGLHVLGSMEPIDLSAEAIRNRLSSTAVSNDINEWDQVPSEFFERGWMTLSPEFYSGAVITDDKPHLEFYLLRTIRSGGEKMHPRNSIW